MYTSLVRGCLGAVLALGLVGPVLAQQGMAQLPVGENWAGGKVQWSSSPTDAMEVRYAVSRLGNEIALCGAYKNFGNTSLQNRTALNKGWLKNDGKKIVRGFTFFAQVPRDKDVTGSPANCRIIKFKGTPGQLRVGFDPVRARF